MRIIRLEFKDFRRFESQRLELHPEVTVLFGENGMGKSTIVDAIAIALSAFPNTSIENRLHDADLRVKTTESTGSWQRVRSRRAQITIEAELDGKEMSWTWSKELGAQISQLDRSGKSVRRVINDLVDRHESLPLVAVYRSNRSWRDAEPHKDELDGDPFVGYQGALDAGSSLADLRGWWRHQELLRKQNHDVPVLDAVEAAVARITHNLVERSTTDTEVPESYLPIYDAQDDDIIVVVPGQGRFAMRELSDGYRGVIAIVSDVARRAAQLHPQPDRNILDNATGVVVIDEIDLHMHPGWQRTVIPNLRRTFPKIQFIVTTHSAEVLSSVDNENVRALESDGVRDTELYVMGRDSNSILVDTMRAGERPPGGADLLRNLYEAVDGGNFQRAEELLVEARELWGPHDAHLAEVEAQLQLER